MEALVCRKLGDPTTSVPTDENSPVVLNKNHPIPPLDSPTSVRVQIRATSLNFANYLQILGKYQEKFPLPFIPGSDYSGVVVAVGPKVSKFRIGDRVCSFASDGSFAQFIVADESRLFRVPDGCDLVAAGALPVAFGTSHVALVHRANLASGQVLLVLGAAGGVGLAAVQIGKVCGAVVIAVASWRKADKRFDETLKLECTHSCDRFRQREIPVIPANIALVKNWTVHGLYWGSYNIHRPQVLEESMNQLLSWLSRGLIRVHISHIYGPPEANLAFSAIKNREVVGKVVLAFEDKTVKSKL